VPSGGYRKPSKPAAVSGPGKFSKRTDGGPGKQPVRPMTGGPYGEGQEMSELQSSAPMSDTQGQPAPSGGGAPVPQVTPFGAPTERPDEPVTAGAPVGEGPGPEAMGMGDATPPEMATLKKYLPLLEPVVNRADVPDSVRQLYMFVRDS
jgi:hypothetical protein